MLIIFSLGCDEFVASRATECCCSRYMCVVVFVVRRYTSKRGGGWVMYAHAGMGGADPHPKSLNLDGG